MINNIRVKPISLFKLNQSYIKEYNINHYNILDLEYLYEVININQSGFTKLIMITLAIINIIILLKN